MEYTFDEPYFEEDLSLCIGCTLRSDVAVDEIRVYDRFLSDDEVTELAEGGGDTPTTTTTITDDVTTTTTIGDVGELYIYGVVVDSEDNGVQGIPVVLKFDSEQDTLLTDANGGFLFPDLEEGTYYVTPSSASTYTPEQKKVELDTQPVYVQFTKVDESSGCPATEIYGTDSDEANLLRTFRDTVLKNDASGKELINLYYAYSPLIVKMMDNDSELKNSVKENIDKVLKIISNF